MKKYKNTESWFLSFFFITIENKGKRGRNMEQYFIYDKRLGIPVPKLEKDWEDYSEDEQQTILLQWEHIRGTIPDRIAELEKMINEKQDELSDESDFERSCRLNSEIAELASVINDLWIWYRMNQTVSMRAHP
jgi:hypothetical protein